MDTPAVSPTKVIVDEQVKIAFLTSQVPFARTLLESLKKEEEVESLQERYKVYPASDKVRFMELCANHQFDLFIIEEDFIQGDPTDWMTKIDTLLILKGFDKRPPVILVSAAEKTTEGLRKSLRGGFNEIVSRPIDLPIILQAINRCLPNKNILASPALFKMNTSDEVNVAQPMTFEAISETEMTVVGTKQFKPGDIVSLYARPFGETSASEVVAVCYASHPLDFTKSKFRTTFNIQGVTPALSRNIRKWIQATSAKQKAG